MNNELNTKYVNFLGGIDKLPVKILTEISKLAVKWEQGNIDLLREKEAKLVDELTDVRSKISLADQTVPSKQTP